MHTQPLRIEHATRRETYAEVSDHLAPGGSVLVQYCTWANGEGADVSLSKGGQIQTFSLSLTELDAIVALHAAARLESPSERA